MRPNWTDRLPVAARIALQAAMVCRRFEAGARVYSRTEAPAGLYVVRSGSAQFCLDGENGRQLLLRILRPNALFGESVAFDGLPAPISVEAREPLEVDVVPRVRLAAIRKQHGEIESALARVIATNLRLMLDVLEEQALLDLREWTVRRLAFLARDDGEPKLARGTVRVRVTQSDLAAMLGASRQATNEMLAGLEARGAITRHFGAIDVTVKTISSPATA